MSDFKNTTMFTHNRLSDFVAGYSNYVDQLITQTTISNEDIYKYHHYEYSPNAVSMTSIGRIPSSALTSISKWASNGAATNTTDGWKMNLGLKYNQVKTNEQQTLDTLSKSLPCPMIYIQPMQIPF